MDRSKNITDQRFGNLIAKEKARKSKHKEWYWRCDCDCGRETIVSLRNLIHGHVKSCGKCNSITFGGKTQTIGEWAREMGIRQDTLHHRIHTYNWSYENALSPLLSNSRHNAPMERRLVILAIENISSTRIARERGLGASISDITSYTKLKKTAVTSTIKWLRTNGCIVQYKKGQWRISKDIPEDFCFSHGLTEQFGGKCLECLKNKGR